MPILQNGGAVAVVQRALRELRQDEQMVELEALLGFFASFVLSTEVVSQIMRWDMAVLRESPWYQEILREGEQRGERRGREEGIQRERQLILKQLTRQVGDLPPNLVTQVQSLDPDQLEALAEDLLDFAALSDLENWLAALPAQERGE